VWFEVEIVIELGGVVAKGIDLYAEGDDLFVA
jgi:hypothetical protein